MIIKQNKTHKAFTMIELIFVIVIMGILSKFGIEFLAQAYTTFIHSSVNHTLQSNSEAAVEFVSTRLQHRIKASTIARETNGSFTLLSNYYGQTAPILEWIGADIDGFRGDANGSWSGIIDLNSTLTTSVTLHSPETNTTALNNLIKILSNNAATVNDSAIYFVNPNALATADGWGWDGNSATFNVTNQSGLNIHPVRSAILTNKFIPKMGSVSPTNSLSGVTASEYYQLAWTAYAVGITDWNNTGHETGTLTMWYNYQPWQGEDYNTSGTAVKIMENVSSFRFIASMSVVKIQVCVKSTLIQNEEYALCKEKTIF